MKFSTILSAAALAASAFAAPIEQPEQDLNSTTIPAEAIISYLDLEGDKDIAVVPFSNATDSGLLFVNTTILAQANKEAGTPLQKREADADANAWHWLRLSYGQPIYKRDANADADADADAWHWLRLSYGQPIYKRDANADADADADAWHWLRLSYGQPIY
ncbi:Mf(Alpha)2p KNAG_0F02140 [Huiozyma naganishii CBS 8797]|uniref:Mating factor alpha n=2 Tax=Huiozyma naganishii TaxID=588726 RepID=J7S8E5_HUIN7|nr:hypothetical protein KNAG_0F02140 [Kazachstania naganishii CBS 8797]BAC00922.1 precursor peptide for alpha mating pheromone [Kazachstania naganishii]CCK70881.1 hypothetical protein KNAG_0F02140 [Kazachstania naganishii CBS 8797]